MGFEEVIARNLAAGDQKVEGGFSSKAVRAVENIAFEVGDTFTFPETYEVYKKNLNGNEVEYINVEVTAGPNAGNVLSFYPSTFSKARQVFNPDKTPTGKRKFTGGTAAKLYRTFATVDKAMDALKGKTVKYTKIETIQTLAYGRDNLATVQISTIDLVEE